MDAGSPRTTAEPASGWTLVPIRRVEDLSAPGLSTDFQAIQLSNAPVTGTRGFAVGDGVVLRSAKVSGRVTRRGALSPSDITLGVGLDVGAGARQWLAEARTGEVRVYGPNAEIDAIHTGRYDYLSVSLSEDRLMDAAELEGLVIDPTVVRQSGAHPTPLATDALAALRLWNDAAHGGAKLHAAAVVRFRRRALSVLIAHLGRMPLLAPGMPATLGHERIVARARAFVDAHLAQPIGVDAIAVAARTSRRSLHRAFIDILGESPKSYVTRLRLHRIRSDLRIQGAARSIAEVSHDWGFGEVGRMSGRYRALFGELPSETQRRRLTRAAADCA